MLAAKRMIFTSIIFYFIFLIVAQCQDVSKTFRNNLTLISMMSAWMKAISSSDNSLISTSEFESIIFHSALLQRLQKRSFETLIEIKCQAKNCCLSIKTFFALCKKTYAKICKFQQLNFNANLKVSKTQILTTSCTFPLDDIQLFHAI